LSSRAYGCTHAPGFGVAPGSWLDPDVILIAGVFAETTRATTKHDIAACQQRLRIYDEAARQAKKGGGR
jgi:hypothetical protein